MKLFVQQPDLETATPQEWVAYSLRKSGISESIIARVLRLNPSPRDGVRLRGIYRPDDRTLPFWRGCMPKGEFIRRYGREAFGAIPRYLLVKRGRRRWVAHTALVDRIWETYQGKRRQAVVAVQIAGGFSGDPTIKLKVMRWDEFARLHFGASNDHAGD